MNILFLMGVYSADSLDGVSTVTNGLVAEFTRRGEAVFIISRKGSEEDVKGALSRWGVSAMLLGRSMMRGKVVRKFILDHKIDVVINQGMFREQSRVCARLFGGSRALSGVKLVNVLHGMPGYEYVDFEKTIKSETRPFKIFTRKVLMACGLYGRYNALKATRGIYSSVVSVPGSSTVLLCPEYIDDFVEKFSLEQYRSQMSSIGNAVKESVASVAAQPFAQKRNQALYVGRLADEKRVEIIINLWKACGPSDWTLVIVGDGYRAEELYERARGVDGIEFVGNQTDVLLYYADSKLIFLTSSNEGLPLCLMEALSQGVVPVTYDISAGVRSVVDGVGVMVPQDDFAALCEAATCLMNDSERLEAMSENAAQVAKRYKISNIVDKWYTLFAQ